MRFSPQKGERIKRTIQKNDSDGIILNIEHGITNFEGKDESWSYE
jgi:hypothetical protein